MQSRSFQAVQTVWDVVGVDSRLDQNQIRSVVALVSSTVVLHFLPDMHSASLQLKRNWILKRCLFRTYLYTFRLMNILYLRLQAIMFQFLVHIGTYKLSFLAHVSRSEIFEGKLLAVVHTDYFLGTQINVLAKFCPGGSLLRGGLLSLRLWCCRCKKLSLYSVEINIASG